MVAHVFGGAVADVAIVAGEAFVTFVVLLLRSFLLYL